MNFDFNVAFKALTGHEPFPWQRRLFVDWLSCGRLPPAIDIPTGLGKTSVMAVWLLARASGANLPRRLVYVVDRRAVVDQATDEAKKLRKRLNLAKKLRKRLNLAKKLRKRLNLAKKLRKRLNDEAVAVIAQVRTGLCLDRGQKLPVSPLRGRRADNRKWMDDPTAPAIIVGTVDMIGSRLLFEGYGVSRGLRPYAAGLLGCDSLVLLDEAHLVPPFERLMAAIRDDLDLRPPPTPNLFPLPPFRMLPLSATLARGKDLAREKEEPFGLEDEDREHEIVAQRLDARKGLTRKTLGEKENLPERLADEALERMRETDGDPRILIYCNARTDAEKVKDLLDSRLKKEKPGCRVILFVGARRVFEREAAAKDLKRHGLIPCDGKNEPVDGDDDIPVFVVATAAGEVGVDLDADHMVCDLVAWERMVQRLGRVNRRGEGAATVLVIDQDKPKPGQGAKGQDASDDFDRCSVRALLDKLPLDDEGVHRAGPGALAGLADDPDPALRKTIECASTRLPLYPALTRALVDSWAMTSLDEHTGRPEVGPWLRGWVKDEPQTSVIWRRSLPVFWDGKDNVKAAPRRDLVAFFEAAPPRPAELLETETRHVADWLNRRVAGWLKEQGKKPDKQPIDPDKQPIDDAELAPLTPNAPVAFVLDGANRPEKDSYSLSLKDIADFKKEKLESLLKGKRLVVDARLGGLEDGLLDPKSSEPVRTIDDKNAEDDTMIDDKDAEAGTWGEPTFRIARLSDDARARPDAQEVLALSCRRTDERETKTWLVVEKLPGGGEGEDARAITHDKEQLLAEHQEWAAGEADRIGERLGLSIDDRAMLRAAAHHHDDGKAAKRWQRASNAPRDGGPWAKTKGPFNWRQLNGYRHEFGSVLDAQTNGLDGLDQTDSRFELALHLIAAHHGNARPVIGVSGHDDRPPSAAEAQGREIALRFARLQRRWGPWGLAWWEALLRAADQRASRRLDKETG